MLYDNSESVARGENPKTKLLVSIREGKLLTSKSELLSNNFPEWAQVIAMAALDAYE